MLCSGYQPFFPSQLAQQTHFEKDRVYSWTKKYNLLNKADLATITAEHLIY